MPTHARIENALRAALEAPRLQAAVQHAVFPGGARIRPQLTLAVARACGDDAPALTDAAAAAVELLHCASLVHDDLPCFDDAPIRRGQPSVHSAFGERLAVLTGDALIVAAFGVLARAGAHRPARLAPLLSTVAAGVGMPGGIVAGQAWECEPRVPLREYQRLKTGALFTAATRAGAIAAGGDPEAWAALGDCLGEAYQVADDIRDVAAQPEWLGKPIGQDVLLGRVTLERAVAPLTAPEHKTLAYEMAVTVCDADGKASTEEKAFLERLRGALSLDRSVATTAVAQADDLMDLGLDAEPTTGVTSAATVGATTAAAAAGGAALAAGASTGNSGVDTAEIDASITRYSILNAAIELLPQGLATAAIVPLQMKMVYRIGAKYGYTLSTGHIKDFLATVGVGMTSQVLENYARKFLGGLGRKVLGKMGGAVVDQATSSAFSFASTYALGHAAKAILAIALNQVATGDEQRVEGGHQIFGVATGAVGNSHHA
ncbi:MAG: geranylgeranyl pyrophosphate synthetase CrtE, partial [Pseudomonadota bacterium]